MATIDPVLVRAAAAASGLRGLNTVPVPGPNLAGVIANDQALLRLGKAFFWDMQAGSDGQSCGSCHFHAGADNRTRNQLSPGLKAGDTRFGNNFLGVPGFPRFAPDVTLVANDFPLHQLQDPEENNFNNRVVLRDTNDVVSSMGVFPARFTGVVLGQSTDAGTAFPDPIFNLDTPSATNAARNVRRVEPRNTPTMINAVFNHSNFWDGRAHFLFNGVSVIGPLDPNARIWVNTGAAGSPPVQQAVRFDFSSLASQAVGPPTSDLEMSFFDRPFPRIGQKLLSLTPLGLQLVDPTDSVLGALSKSPLPGLNTSYEALIQAAFLPKYWNGASVTIAGVGTVRHIEANFTLFWGLAVQRYEQTLVSDRAPFDAFMNGNNSALTQAQLQGLLVFLNRGARGNFPEVDAAINDAQLKTAGLRIGAGNCVSCHGGPEFTDAAFTSLTEAPGELELIEIEDTTVLSGGFLAISLVQGLLDNGFSNIGVRPTNDDLGRGGKENGHHLSFTRQMLFEPNLLNGVIDRANFPCNGGNCPAQLLVDGAFKVPGLRNVELTAPYFHNGGQATLSQVVEFYDRQSDFANVNIANIDRNLVFINLDEPDEGPLVSFLVSLTDDRVRFERAPFDHPQLFVPRGGTAGSPVDPIVVPAVGAAGRPSPLRPTF